MKGVNNFHIRRQLSMKSTLRHVHRSNDNEKMWWKIFSPLSSYFQLNTPECGETTVRERFIFYNKNKEASRHINESYIFSIKSCIACITRYFDFFLLISHTLILLFFVTAIIFFESHMECENIFFSGKIIYRFSYFFSSSSFTYQPANKS